ncbi:MAG: hypothetical protein AAGM36_03050 [Cyanobacteria bacterium J06597_1]
MRHRIVGSLLLTNSYSREVSVDIERVREIVQRAVADRQLTRAEQDEIMAAVLADGRVSPEEQDLLREIQEDIRLGKIKSVD